MTNYFNANHNLFPKLIWANTEPNLALPASWDRVEKCWIMQRPLEQTDSSAPKYSEEEPEIYVQT